MNDRHETFAALMISPSMKGLIDSWNLDTSQFGIEPLFSFTLDNPLVDCRYSTLGYEFERTGYFYGEKSLSRIIVDKSMKKEVEFMNFDSAWFHRHDVNVSGRVWMEGLSLETVETIYWYWVNGFFPKHMEVTVSEPDMDKVKVFRESFSYLYDHVNFVMGGNAPHETDVAIFRAGHPLLVPICGSIYEEYIKQDTVTNLVYVKGQELDFARFLYFNYSFEDFDKLDLTAEWEAFKQYSKCDKLGPSLNVYPEYPKLALYAMYNYLQNMIPKSLQGE